MSQTDIPEQLDPNPAAASQTAPQPITGSDVYAACRDFALNFALNSGQHPALPALEPDNVFQGWQNRSALPPGGNDYAVISVLSTARQGTPLENFDAPDPDPAVPGKLTIQALHKIMVRLDFCGEDDNCRQRAQLAALAASSGPGVSFFNQRGLSILYAEEVREQSFTDEARQYVRRYFTTLCLSQWSGFSLDCDYFDRVKLSRIREASAGE